MSDATGDTRGTVELSCDIPADGGYDTVQVEVGYDEDGLPVCCLYQGDDMIVFTHPQMRLLYLFLTPTRGKH